MVKTLRGVGAGVHYEYGELGILPGIFLVLSAITYLTRIRRITEIRRTSGMHVFNC